MKVDNIKVSSIKLLTALFTSVYSLSSHTPNHKNE